MIVLKAVSIVSRETREVHTLYDPHGNLIGYQTIQDEGQDLAPTVWNFCSGNLGEDYVNAKRKAGEIFPTHETIY